MLYLLSHFVEVDIFANFLSYFCRWLSADRKNVLHLQLGMFGYEHIYMALAKRFSTKVHIARWRMNAYHDLPAVQDCLTVDGESTRIHACSFKVW